MVGAPAALEDLHDPLGSRRDRGDPSADLGPARREACVDVIGRCAIEQLWRDSSGHAASPNAGPKCATTLSRVIAVGWTIRRLGASEHARPGSAPRRSSRPPICSPCNASRSVRRAHHVDVVADQVLALARRIAAAADRHAEAGQHERARERAHRAAGRRRAAPRHCANRPGSSAGEQRERRLRDTVGRAAGARAASRPARSGGTRCRRGRRGSSAPAPRRARRDRGTRRPACARAPSA